MTTRYHLEKYRGKATRHTCPGCEQPHQFTRYVDGEGQPAAPHVGKCNRVESCGYHYPPRQYFADNPDAQANRGNNWRDSEAWKRNYQPPTPTPEPAPQALPQSVFLESLAGRPCNFVAYLAAKFGEDVAQDLRRRFQIGRNDDIWPGATVFWIVGPHGEPFAAQVIQYDPATGKTVKYTAQDGSKGRRASWIHTALRKRHQRQNKPLPGWLEDYDAAPKWPVPFGLQVLPTSPGKNVGIVESAKTAVVLSQLLPDVLWLAVGSLENLTAARLEVVRGRVLVLYPDAGARAFKRWSERAAQMKRAGFVVSCSDLLEQYANEDEYANGYDLADYLLNQQEPPAPIVAQKEQPATSSPQNEPPTLPDGWSINDAGAMCDADDLPILDWWTFADVWNATDQEREAALLELSQNGVTEF